MKKHTSRVALCGVMSALSAAIMLFSYFPSMIYAIPAIAGLVFTILVVEAGYKWAFGAFAATSVLVLLLAEPEAKVMFVAFFGYYPIIKGLIEKLNRRWLEYIIKFAVFNAAVISVYLLLINVLAIPLDGMGDFGKYTPLILLALGNITFFIYDFAVSRLLTLYIAKLHPRVKRMFK